jgi:Ferritin-like domain
MEKETEQTPLSNLANKLGRRSFVRGAGLAGMGLAGAAFTGAKLGMLDNVPGVKALGLSAQPVEASMDMSAELDAQVVNLALNLEYLEAEFYTMATTGKTIEESGVGIDGVGTPGPTTGGQKVDFVNGNGSGSNEVTGMLTKIALEIAEDERTHVRILRSALGDAAIAKPAINLDALGIGFANFRQFLQLSRAFEDTGVSAYGGAAYLLTDKTVLGTAVRIALTEALHSANLRLLIAENNIQTAALDSLDVLPPPSGSKYFETDTRAFAVTRSIGQVLSIVYGSSKAGTNKGGFFPAGLNGRFTTV